MEAASVLRMIYLTEEDWSIIELSLDKEQLRYYNSILAIMNSLSSKLKYSNQTVTSTAMIYFHKYTLTLPLKERRLNGLDKVFVCAACLFISTKATNRLVSLREIIVNMRFFIENKTKVKALPFTNEELRGKVDSLEQEVLEHIGFDTNVDLPYRLLPKIRSYLEQHTELNVKNIIDLWCYYINDSFSLPLCLYFAPDVIAIACICILAKKFSIKVDKESLCDLSHFVISDEDIAHCEKVIMLIFESKEKRLDHMSKEANSKVNGSIKGGESMEIVNGDSKSIKS